MIVLSKLTDKKKNCLQPNQENPVTFVYCLTIDFVCSNLPLTLPQTHWRFISAVTLNETATLLRVFAIAFSCLRHLSQAISLSTDVVWMQLSGSVAVLSDSGDALFDNICPVIFTEHFQQPSGLHHWEWLCPSGEAADGGCPALRVLQGHHPGGGKRYILVELQWVLADWMYDDLLCDWLKSWKNMFFVRKKWDLWHLAKCSNNFLFRKQKLQLLNLQVKVCTLAPSCGQSFLWQGVIFIEAICGFCRY